MISERIAVFPGDQVFTRKWSMSTLAEGHLTLSSIHTTLHLGAHADALNHTEVSHEGIDQRSLFPYFGPCQVLEVDLIPGTRIYPDHLGNKVLEAPRILFKTHSYPNPEQWNENFNSLSPELIDFLAHQKICLVGIDTPSVDPWDSKALESHHALNRHRIANLEGLVLTDVKEGLYTVSAFPLRIEGADASPVRAVLMRE